jgi:cyclase
MLKTRIIPCLDVQNGRVANGINVVDLRDAGDPVKQTQLYDGRLKLAAAIAVLKGAPC